MLFHGKRHPHEMGTPNVKAFLTHLAGKATVAASTRYQALSAFLFLSREALKRSRGPIAALHATKPKRLPAVLVNEEVRRVLDHLSDTHRLMVQRRYGSGLRLMERLRLRVKDLDFARRSWCVTVRV
ncbi:phage integrase N-terminal SAM-like domain-containing protein [uncultured Chloroflexus sp.]|uniref:phage integrase N-terminal SAM-like domain-containing protein n=1 Tax=uncultured Chloroflexus sp. TaxID=214040 RepID=UPI00261607FC|nr:phage integrase N-terminal SAM-like domain-containing protein [uncultured Chloroflexus sp.]